MCHSYAGEESCTRRQVWTPPPPSLHGWRLCVSTEAWFSVANTAQEFGGSKRQAGCAFKKNPGNSPLHPQPEAVSWIMSFGGSGELCYKFFGGPVPLLYGPIIGPVDLYCPGREDRFHVPGPIRTSTVYCSKIFWLKLEIWGSRKNSVAVLCGLLCLLLNPALAVRIFVGAREVQMLSCLVLCLYSTQVNWTDALRWGE